VFRGRNGGPKDRRGAVAALAIAFVLAAAFAATVRVEWSGRRFGLYLLRSPSGRPFVLKDDLRISDLPRYLAGHSFRRHDARPPHGQPPHLHVEWDAADGSGYVTHRLADGRVLETVFGRYQEDDDREPQGLFVGGAVPEVVARYGFDESGMSVRDARGWHHLWCTVNEAWLLAGRGRNLYPADWRLVGSRVLERTRQRVVIESDHRFVEGAFALEMVRRATFVAGQPWFRLEIRFVNVGDAPVTFTYGYGDEPWVGRYGSAAGNVGWLRRGLVTVAGRFEPVVEPWAGIYDAKSGDANFIAWPGTPPDLAYFGNHAGAPQPGEIGAPLASNEVFIGLEWQRRTLAPAGSLLVRLDVGQAELDDAGTPILPDGAAPRP
jgi:hypothetical protein